MFVTLLENCVTEKLGLKWIIGAWNQYEMMSISYAESKKLICYENFISNKYFRV